MIRHVVTLFYEPTKEAKDLYEQMKKKEGQDLHFVNCGNLATVPV